MSKYSDAYNKERRIKSIADLCEIETKEELAEIFEVLLKELPTVKDTIEKRKGTLLNAQLIIHKEGAFNTFNKTFELEIEACSCGKCKRNDR